MNPEFRRQLWLKCSPTRLLVMPIVLALCLVIVAATDPADMARGLVLAGSGLFLLLSCVLGTLAVSSSLSEEVIERTWDLQRMSAIGPWSMVWGKILGASSYCWYGALLCLCLVIPCALSYLPAELVVKLALTALLQALMLQSLALVVSVQLLKWGRQLLRRSSSVISLLLLLWAFMYLNFNLRFEFDRPIHWWGLVYQQQDFSLVSLLVFSILTLFAGWRMMAGALAIRQLPWAGPLIFCLLSAYLAGFAEQPSLWQFGWIGFCLSAGFIYLALLFESSSRPVWQRVLNRLQRRQWREAGVALPQWPSLVLMAGVFALLISLRSIDRLPSLFGIEALLPLGLLILLLRDCALALYFGLAAQQRYRLKNFQISMLILYLLLPWLAMVFESEWLLIWVLPISADGLSWLVALLHLLLALALLYWRWQRRA